MPARWRDTYQDAIDDPELLSLRGDLARIDHQIDELLAAMPQGEEEEAFAAFLSHFHAAMGALDRSRDNERKPEEREDAQRDFFVAIETARMLWTEKMQYHLRAVEIEGRLSDLTESRRRLVETETRRISAAVCAIPIDRVRAVVWALLEIIRREVSDHRLLARIQERLRKEFTGITQRSL